ncbi:hypothetical protein IL306_008015 [Fusarium sp. DS 682]|nr:hypothetical protein IL306_008015 [Fusarium sp. DS 682]
MVVVATNGQSGQVQLYESGNLDSWSHVGALYAGDGSTGKILECPNFFPLGDKWVLFYWPSPKWPSRVNGWAGQLSITRELFIRKEGGLGHRPVSELKTLASGPAKKVGVTTITSKGLHVGKWKASVDTTDDGKFSLDIFLDKSVLEIFTGDGIVFSAAVFPRYQESQDISIVASGGMLTVESIALTPLGSSWC